MSFLLRKRDNYEKYILDKYSFPSDKLDINSINDKKKFICHSYITNINNFEYIFQNKKFCHSRREASDKTSIFFSSLVNNDNINVGFINYLLNDCQISLETTEFILEYRNAMRCKCCKQFYCLSENFPEEEKITPLMYAVLKENYRATQFLIRKGANVNFQTKRYRMTPLLLACRLENSSIVELLVKSGADVTHCDVVNKTCIMHFLSSCTCIYYQKIYSKDECCYLFYSHSKLGRYCLAFKKIVKIVRNKITDEKMKDLLNKPELVRNYTPYHVAMKIDVSDIRYLISKYGGSRTLKNLMVYNDNKLSTVLNYFDKSNNINHDYDDNNKKLSLLHYCLTSLGFRDYYYKFYYNNNSNKKNKVPYFKICNNKYYSKKEISNACMIIYFEHFKNYDSYDWFKVRQDGFYSYESKLSSEEINNIEHNFKKYISIYDANIKKFNNFVSNGNNLYANKDYLEFCLSELGCNNKIIEVIFSKNCKINQSKLNAEEKIMETALTILLRSDSNIILGGELWQIIFDELHSHYRLNDDSHITCKQLMDIMINCLEKKMAVYNRHYQNNNNNNNNRKLFVHFLKNHRDRFLFSIFDTVYISIEKRKKNQEKNDNYHQFKKLLLLIDRYNKGDGNFNIFYEAMRYIKYKTLDAKEKEQYLLPKFIKLLEIIKSFNEFEMYPSKITDTTNDSSVIFYEFNHNIITLNTPFSVALMINLRVSNKNYKLINFFIDNDCNMDLKNDVCSKYLIYDIYYNDLKCFIPVIYE